MKKLFTLGKWYYSSKMTSIVQQEEFNCQVRMCSNVYLNLGVFNMFDHIIKKYEKDYKHPAFVYSNANLEDVIRNEDPDDEDDDDDDDQEYGTINIKVLDELEQYAIYHPNSNETVIDLIHPSRYPFVPGVTLDHEGKCLDQYEIDRQELSPQPELRLSRLPNTVTNYKWLPSVFHVTDDKVTLKSYINDLFVPEELKKRVEKEVCNAFGVALQLFEDLAYYMNMPKEMFRNRDLQVMVKCASYKLNPGEEYEGVWHVEGVPQEHIIMSSILYYRDELPEVPKLAFRREVCEDEENKRIMMFPQYTEFNDQDRNLQVNIGEFQTQCGNMYAWTNGAQHKLKKIVNTSDKVVQRSMLVFFLVDPQVKLVDTSMVPPQNTYMSNEIAYHFMQELMKERSHIKVMLNSDLDGEISYCEH